MDPQALLKRDFPELRVDTLDRLGEGWDHIAFLVNNVFVFRLPWHVLDPDSEPDGGGAPTAPAEVELLRALAGRLPVAVPEPVYVADNGQYFGYTYLPGRSLDDLRLDGSWQPDPEGAFADLAVDVITAIEDVLAASDAAAMGVRVAEMPRYPEQEQLAMRSGLLTQRMRSSAGAVAEALPDRWQAATARPLATLHADLGLDHWLVESGQHPYALIDWSDSCVGPPELQLSTLMWHVPELAASVAHRYVQRTGRVIDGELIFGCGFAGALSDLGELLGADEPDEVDVEWTVECLRRWGDPDLVVSLAQLTG